MTLRARTFRRIVLVATLIAATSFVAVASLPTPASATSPTDAIRLLNVQRAANGIPPVTLSEKLTTGCQRHLTYMELNQSYTHGETPGAPGYTREGAGFDGYGGWEVLSGHGAWSAVMNPWDQAPFHVRSMMDPHRTEAGYAEGPSSQQCMRLAGNVAEPSQPQFYAYTGYLGRTDVRVQESSCESPVDPAEMIGRDCNDLMSPFLLLFGVGAGTLEPLSYSITGPGGPVDARFVQDRTLATDGVLFSPRPLKPFSDYSVRVSWQTSASGVQEQAFAFRTERVHATTVVTERDGVLSVTSDNKQPVRLTLRARAGRASFTARVAPGHRVPIDVPARGLYRLCFQQDGIGPFRDTTCKTTLGEQETSVFVERSLRLGAGVRKRNVVTFALRATALRSQTARVEIVYQRRICSMYFNAVRRRRARSCGIYPRAPIRRLLRIRPEQVITTAVPKPGLSVAVSVVLARRSSFGATAYAWRSFKTPSSRRRRIPASSSGR